MSISAKTKICCVIGNPIKHSMSPSIHNAGYKALELNFVYVPFCVENIKEAILGIRGLGIVGTSVTVPHKTTVMQYLDIIDETAKKIGAVNTVYNDNGKLIGSNTDYIGAIRALEEKTSLANKKVAVIGAGGAARAIVFGLKQKGATTTIFNRNKDAAKKLARDAECLYESLEQIKKIKTFDIVVNATSVGMLPNVNDSIIAKEYLSKHLVVMDIVYNPKETKLIKGAKETGCELVFGYKMLLYQAVGQFELFTKHKAPVATMEKSLLEQLEKNYE